MCRAVLRSFFRVSRRGQPLSLQVDDLWWQQAEFVEHVSLTIGADVIQRFGENCFIRRHE